MRNSHTKKIVTVALLIAMDILLTRFLSIQATPAVRISFGFAAIAIVAMLYGPVYAGLGAAIADFVGVVLFSAYAPFPGFTLTAFLTGVVYGLFLRKSPLKMWRICAAALIVTVGLNFLLDTYWLSIIFEGRGFYAILPERIVRTAIMLPLQIVTLRFVTSERFAKILKR